MALAGTKTLEHSQILTSSMRDQDFFDIKFASLRAAVVPSVAGEFGLGRVWEPKEAGDHLTSDS